MQSTRRGHKHVPWNPQSESPGKIGNMANGALKTFLFFCVDKNGAFGIHCGLKAFLLCVTYLSGVSELYNSKDGYSLPKKSGFASEFIQGSEDSLRTCKYEHSASSERNLSSPGALTPQTW